MPKAQVNGNLNRCQECGLDNLKLLLKLRLQSGKNDIPKTNNA